MLHSYTAIHPPYTARAQKPNAKPSSHTTLRLIFSYIRNDFFSFFIYFHLIVILWLFFVLFFPFRFVSVRGQDIGSTTL